MKNLCLPSYISRSLKIPVRCFNRTDLTFPEVFCKIADFDDEPFSNALMLTKEAQGCSTPLILSVENAFSYSLTPADEYLYLLGPVRFREAVYFSHVFTFDSLGISKDLSVEAFIQTVPAVDFKTFSDQTLLVCNLHREGPPLAPFLEEITFLSENCVDKTAIRSSSANVVKQLLGNLENGVQHNPYSQEIHERDSIRNGDTEALRLALNETFSGSYGKLSDNPLRQEIDMGIVTITIATRAAIEGGLHHESVFSFCDLTIRQMEASTDPVTVRHIYRNAEYKLAEMVRDHKNKQNGKSEKSRKGRENHHISHCKDYIFSHLHEKITVRQIAENISLDPSYLSSLFSACEHMTLKQYIMTEKINLAKNMLIYSSYTHIQIASYLGFCSQSHLGSEFKKATGMSLRQYREAYLKESFIDTSPAERN